MEEEIAQATIQVAEKACSLVVEIGMQTAVFLSSATGDAVKGVAGATKDALTQGKTSIAKLSKKSGGGLNVTEELSRADVKSLKSRLHQYKVNYAVEKNHDTGKYYIHFQGQDADMVKHALDLSLDSIGAKINLVQQQEAPSQSKTTKLAATQEASRDTQVNPRPKSKKTAADVKQEIKTRTQQKIVRSRQGVATPQKIQSRGR